MAEDNTHGIIRRTVEHVLGEKESLAGDGQASDSPGWVAGVRKSWNFVRGFPRQVRLLIYGGSILFLPIYLSLSLQFVRDVLEERMENVEILFHLHAPRPWYAKVGLVPTPPTSLPPNLYQAPPSQRSVSLGDKGPALTVNPMAFFRLDRYYEVYDFQAETDVTWSGQNKQDEFDFALRASRDGSSLYLLQILFATTGVTLRAFDIDRAEAKPLFIDNPAPPYGLPAGPAKMHVHIWGEGCVFPVYLNLDQSSQQSPSLIYADSPCRLHGTFGVGALAGDPGKVFSNTTLCASSDQTKFACGDDFSTFYNKLNQPKNEGRSR